MYLVIFLICPALLRYITGLKDIFERDWFLKKVLENIDRKSFEPAYIQIANIIRQRIASGEYRPGSRLPSESELRKVYDVSPMTIRRSINLLLDQGVVDTIQGSGTFVRPMALDAVAFKLEEFNRIIKDSEQTKVKLLEVQIERADDVIAQKLDISRGDRAILLRRLIFHEMDPVLYQKEYLIYDPSRPIVEAEMEVTSLHGLIYGTGESDLKYGKLVIEPIVLEEEEADLLNAPKKLPAFRLEHIFYDFYDHRVSWGRFTCRGDRFQFTTEIGFSGKT
jgi:GntR family transcriptional regulator